MTDITRRTFYTITSSEGPTHSSGALMKFIKDRLRSVFSGIRGAAVVVAVFDEHGNRLTGGDDGDPSDELLDQQEEAIARLIVALEKEDLIA